MIFPSPGNVKNIHDNYKIMRDMYRNLSPEEIEALTRNGCRCDNWNLVKVKEGFLPEGCIN